MIKHLQRRPMVRPLIIWILGVLLQASWQIVSFSWLLLIVPFAVLSLSYWFVRSEQSLVFSYRWVWGVLYLVLLLFLSIQITAHHTYKPPGFSSESRLSQQASTIQKKMTIKMGTLNLTEEEKSVLSTIVLGNREKLSYNTRQQFVVTGAAHILAVSGMHVAIVCGFFTFLLGLIPYKNKLGLVTYILQMFIIWGYVLLTGSAPSAIRAGCMLSFYLTGKKLVKNTDSYNTLAASAFCMLVYNPYFLFDIGFQLSYIAVFFILYLEPLIRNPFVVRNPLLATPLSWITVALAAQIGVTLVCLYYFKTITLLFLFSALPLMFFITLLLPVGMIYILLPDGYIPGYGILEWVVSKLTHYFCNTVELFSNVQGLNYSISLNKYGVVLGYILLITCTEWIRYRKKSYL